MKNKMDALLSEKINNLDTVPPGVSLDKEANWEKIKRTQKGLQRKTDFGKGIVWGIVSVIFVSGILYLYGFEKSEKVSDVKSTAYAGPVTEKTESQLKEQPTPVYVKPEPIKGKTAQEKTVASRSVLWDTSMKIIVPQAAIKSSADKQKEANTIKIPKVERHPSLIGNTLEEDFRPVMAQQGENLVRNGTFEQGSVGFKSDFRFLPHEAFVVGYAPATQATGNQQTIGAPQINVSPIIAGSYIITDGFSHQKNRFFYSNAIYYDSSGFLSPSDSLESSIVMSQTAVNPVPSTGSFLAVNINISGKQRIWYDSITVKPNTTYSFSCILANVSTQFLYNGPNPGAFKLCVNGEKISKVLDLPHTNEWRTLSGMFISGRYQTRIEISIEDIQSPMFNNLVALDNIVFKETAPGTLRKKKERFPK